MVGSVTLDVRLWSVCYFRFEKGEEQTAGVSLKLYVTRANERWFSFFCVWASILMLRKPAVKWMFECREASERGRSSEFVLHAAWEKETQHTKANWNASVGLFWTWCIRRTHLRTRASEILLKQLCTEIIRYIIFRVTATLLLHKLSCHKFMNGDGCFSTVLFK